jgi:hypothetical protein
MRNVLGVIGMAVPVVAYFLFLHHYALNVIFLDQWSDIYTINHDWLNNLWAQHDVQRIFFPNLVVIALAAWSHLNVVLEEFISAMCLTAATGLFVFSHRRWAPETSWLFYVPFVAVLFSLNQVEDTLWGFQLAWYMVLLSLAAAIYVIDSRRLSWYRVAVAMVVAVIGSFSSLMGLFIWPACLLLLLHRRRPKAFAWVWSGGAVITAALYFHGFAFTQSESGNDNSYALAHPLVAVKYLVFSLGGSVGVPSSPDWVPMLLGAVLLVLSIAAVVTYGFRRDDTSGRAVGVALVAFGLLFAGSTALGRAWAGLFYASRYNTFYFLLLAGCALVFFDRSGARARGTQPVRGTGSAAPDSSEGRSGARHARRPRRSTWHAAGVVVVAALVCLEVVSGSQQGIVAARSWRATQIEAAAVTLHIDQVSDATIDAARLYPGTRPSFLRMLAGEAAARHLSLFGVAPSFDLSTLEHGTARVVRPPPGSVLRGRVVLAAQSTSALGVSSLTFRLSGGPLPHPEIVARSVALPYFRAAFWNSTAVPDGSYELQAVAVSTLGSRFVSPAVSVRVEN